MPLSRAQLSKWGFGWVCVCGASSRVQAFSKYVQRSTKYDSGERPNNKSWMTPDTGYGEDQRLWTFGCRVWFASSRVRALVLRDTRLRRTLSCRTSLTDPRVLYVLRTTDSHSQTRLKSEVLLCPPVDLVVNLVDDLLLEGAKSSRKRELLTDDWS